MQQTVKAENLPAQRFQTDVLLNCLLPWHHRTERNFCLKVQAAQPQVMCKNQRETGRDVAIENISWTRCSLWVSSNTGYSMIL